MPDHTQSWREAISGKLSIGDFVVDADANELHRDGRVTRLRPLLMDVLRRLAASAGNVVTREQLLDDAWPRRMVNDEVLSRAIAELRTALDDDAKAPRYVETLPKVGYRLIAAVARVLENRPAGEGAPVLENPPTGEGAPVPDAGMPTPRARLLPRRPRLLAPRRPACPACPSSAG